jgi:hypothetical protein
MILTSRENRTVKIVNDFDRPSSRATDYDWNRGAGFFRSAFINGERFRAGLDDTHGFRVYYYGTGNEFRKVRCQPSRRKSNRLMMKQLIIILIASISLISNCSCGALWGAYDLGNRLTLFEGNNSESRQIIYCTGYSGGACISGIPVIPSRQDTVTSYIVAAKSNTDWVIAKSKQVRGQEDMYWIISKKFSIEGLNCDNGICDSILQSKVSGPFELTQFKDRLSELKINLHF